MLTIWKITHDIAEFKKHKRISELKIHLDNETVVAWDPGKKEPFSVEIKPGDYFYLCHNDNLVLFGRILTESIPDDVPKWQQRSYEMIKKRVPIKYHGEIKDKQGKPVKKDWEPGFGDLISKVTPGDLELFEEHILQKYFGLKFTVGLRF